MKKQQHFMPYPKYHPQQQQLELYGNNSKIISNDKLGQLNNQQQAFVTQLQPTHHNYNNNNNYMQQRAQHQEPFERFKSTTTAATDTLLISNSCNNNNTTTNTTNTEMSSLTSGNVCFPQQQQFHQIYQQDYNYFYNNYLNNNNNYIGNNNSNNNDYSEQISNQIKAFSNNNNNINYINCFPQQQRQNEIVVKEEFVDEQQQQQQQKQLQFEKRKQLQLPLTTNLLQSKQQQQQQNIIESKQQIQNENNNFNTIHPLVVNNCNLNVSTTATTTTTAATNNCTSDKITMDAREIANFLANELFMQQLVSMDGMQSGVPTLTTSTLTPTTLRSIEETFIHLTSEPINAPYQAGFIPPPLGTFSATPTTTTGTIAAASSTVPFNNGSSLPDFGEFAGHETESDDDGSQSSWNGPQYIEDNSLATTDNSSAATDSTSYQNGSNGLGGNVNSTSNASSTNDFTAVFAAATAIAKQGANNNLLNNNNLRTTTGAPRRNVGGRRPTKPTNMSPEEEEKRRIRRERNKEAAARCRKRRVDQTNELLEEVAQLEKKRELLQKEIESLTTTKQDLMDVMDAHRPTCQKIRNDLLSVNTIGGLIAPTITNASNNNNNNNINNNSNNNNRNTTEIALRTGAQARSMSPIDIKPIILHDQILNFIKNEPLESALDSNSSLDHDGPPSPKRLLKSSNNPMIPPPLPLPNVGSITASLNTPIITTAPVNFNSFSNNNATLNTLNALNNNKLIATKPRPNSLPTNPRNSAQLALNVDGKAPTDINGVAIQTPSTGVFNFDSLMDGGTGLTPVSGPLVPNCSSQNKHPLELATPTTEPSKLVSL